MLPAPGLTTSSTSPTSSTVAGLLQPSADRLSAVRRQTSLLVAAVLATVLMTATHAGDVSFSRDVLPLLSEHCFTCHGPDDGQRQADLRLDRQTDALKIIDLQHPDQSALLQRVMSADPETIMPPPEANRPLTARQISTLQQWIQQGAPWGQHWSFEPLQKPAVPEPQFAEFPVRNPIDHFVQQKLRQHGLTPSPEADRRTLIRRAALDLTGLPPTPEQVDAFLQDQRPDAFEQLVEQLLNAPEFGERMAWDWLDAARYADSNGYQGDSDRTMWPWRDWVVQAFNRNLAYDQFTIWQLAGDLLPEPTAEQQLATAFCRNHMINGEGGRIPEENRVDYVMDMTETMGTVWLGLTLNCCRCHDHKFDPLSRRNYYEFFAFFNQTPVDGGGGNPQTPPVLDWPSAEQQAELDRIARELSAVQQQLTAQERPDQDPERAALVAERDRLQQLEKDVRKAVPRVMIMADRPEWRTTFVLDRGLYNQPSDQEVRPALPESLPGWPQTAADANRNRLDLARWLVSPEQPLTARVTVNRFWQQVFGTGLVKTTEDFGVQGEYPEHRELLDWLAADFRDSGWDVKRLLRTMVTSHTWRQSSRVTATSRTDDTGRRLTVADVDPENRLLARASRYRLPAWMLRDQALAVSGLLNRQQGGPPVNVYQPPGVWEEATFGNRQYVQDHGPALYRRSLYVFWRRIIGPTMFFDNATRQTCQVKVVRTNTPLHALLTLNDTAWVEAARVLAESILRQTQQTTDQQRLQQVYERILCRPPAPAEQSRLLSGLQRSRQHFQDDHEAAVQLLTTGEAPRDESLPAAEHAAWTSLCLAVLNLDETLTRE